MVANNYLQIYTYEYLIEQALRYVPDTVDKREGSIIFDALAPFCYEMAEMFIQLGNIALNSYIETATGEFLDLKVVEQGITRYPATASIRLLKVTPVGGYSVPIGSIFELPDGSIQYKVTEKISSTDYRVEALTLGTVGNTYIGTVIPTDTNVSSNISSSELTSILVPARDVETDDELRTRFLAYTTEKAFGGNFNDYVNWLKGISYVKYFRIYPVQDVSQYKILLYVLGDGETEVSSYNLADIVTKLNGVIPLGHTVEALNPPISSINISATVTPKVGYDIPTLTPKIQTALENYFKTILGSWDDFDSNHNYYTKIYVSAVTAAIMGVEGVANIANLKFNNNTATDIEITGTRDSATNTLYKLGSVTIG